MKRSIDASTILPKKICLNHPNEGKLFSVKLNDGSLLIAIYKSGNYYSYESGKRISDIKHKTILNKSTNDITNDQKENLKTNFELINQSEDGEIIKWFIPTILPAGANHHAIIANLNTSDPVIYHFISEGDDFSSSSSSSSSISNDAKILKHRLFDKYIFDKKISKFDEYDTKGNIRYIFFIV
jgi:hypothetical protein